MIKEKIIVDLKIAENELEKNVVFRGSGKILNIFVEFNEEVRTNINLEVNTKIGEKVLDIQGSNRINSEVFYPRCDTARGRKYGAVMVDTIKGEEDYFYFHNGLIVTVKKDNLKEDRILIRKMIILYEEI